MTSGGGGGGGGGRLYQKSLIAHANAALRLPLIPNTSIDEVGTPASSPERFTTPNETMATHDLSWHKRAFNFSGDDHSPPPPPPAQLVRMKSLGNLPLFQRDFGGTPQDIVRMRRDFETHRFGMARMKSLTDLMEMQEAASPRLSLSPSAPLKSSQRQQNQQQQHQKLDDMRFAGSLARDSIFKRNNANGTSSSGGHRIGVGDTKFIGNNHQHDRSALMHANRKLSKNKSMGMIPDLICERGERYDAFRTSKKCAKDEAEVSDDEDDEEEDDVTSYEHFNVVLRGGYQVSEPGGGGEGGASRRAEEVLGARPFERGYRGSYMRMSSVSPQQSPQMMVRHSDGWHSRQQQQYSPVASHYHWAMMYRYQQRRKEAPAGRCNSRGTLVDAKVCAREITI